MIIALRRSAVLQAYDWKEMVRDQTRMMQHQAVMLTRRGKGASLGAPAPLLKRFDGSMVAPTSLAPSLVLRPRCFDNCRPPPCTRQSQVGKFRLAASFVDGNGERQSGVEISDEPPPLPAGQSMLDARLAVTSAVNVRWCLVCMLK